MPALRNLAITGSTRWSRTADLKFGEYVCRRCGIVRDRHGGMRPNSGHLCKDCRSVESTRRRPKETETDV